MEDKDGGEDDEDDDHDLRMMRLVEDKDGPGCQRSCLHWPSFVFSIVSLAIFIIRGVIHDDEDNCVN